MAFPNDSRPPRPKNPDRGGAQPANRPPALPKHQPPPAEDGPTMLFDMEAIVQDAEPLRPISLYVERGVHQGRSFQVPEGTLVIGRGSAAGLRLEHDSISRRHATLSRRGNQFIVRDLGSQNGTYINRSKISGDVELQVGDTLAIGQSVLRLNELEAKPARKISAATTPAPDLEDEPWRRRKTPMVIGGAVGVLALGLVGVWLLRGGKTSTQDESSSKRSVAQAQGSPSESKHKSTRSEAGRARADDGAVGPSPSYATRHKTHAAEQKVASPPDSKRERIETPQFAGLPKSSPEPTPPPAKVGNRSPARPAERTRQPTGVAAIAQYKVGDVAGALEAAKNDPNGELRAKLARFDTALNQARESLGAGDNAAALNNFILALRVDEGISKGTGVYAAQIRKQLGALYTATGSEQLESNNPEAARQAFALALKYDPSNEKAKAGARKAQAAVASKPAVKPAAEDEQTEEAPRPAKVRRTPNRERAAAIDAAFGG